MEVSGKIKMIDATKEVGTSGFKKRDIVITTDEQYPQHILVQFVQDKCELLDKYNVGEVVDISVNLRGREWVNPQGETTYFNTIQGWRIAKDNQTPQEATTSFEPATTFTEEEHDDMPF